MDCYKGPYVVKSLIGNSSISVGDYDRPKKNKTVFAGHAKPFYLPDSVHWSVHPVILVGSSESETAILSSLKCL